MKVLIGTIFISTSLVTTIVSADSCAPVGNRAQFLPLYDQGQTSMCYAYTSAQMWDVWRKNSGEKVPPLTSASELAFRYTSREANARDWKEVQTGNTIRTTQMLASEGGCPHYNAEDFRRDQFGERWAEFEHLSALRREYFKLEERIEKGKKGSGLFSSKDPQDKQRELIDKFACELVPEEKFPAEFRFMSDFIKSALDTGTTMRYFQKYFEKGCLKHGRLTSKAGAKSWTISDPASRDKNILQLRKQLNKVLESGKGAPAISYCSSILSNPGVDGIKLNKKGMLDCSLGDSHASIVVDRRPGKNGSCEYLVRNTWGTSCNAYAWPCQLGQIWVPEHELLKNTMSVMWLE